MKLALAIVLGFLSGVLLYGGSWVLLADPTFPAPTPSALFVLVALVGGWIASSAVLYRGAKSVSRVFRRGALLGVGEWLFVGLVGIARSERIGSAVIASPTTPSDVKESGAAVAGGVVATVSGGVSIVMAIVCLIVFAIAYFAGREVAAHDGRGAVL